MTLQKKSAYKLGKMADVDDLIEQTYYFEQKVFEFNQKIEANKKHISKSMGRKTKLEVRADEGLYFTATKNVQTKIKFHKDQLFRKLEKQKYKKAVDKVVTIKDLNGLIKMLKEYEVPPKEFKQFLKTEEFVNDGAINEMLELGELDIDDLQGCYKADFSENIQVKRILKN